MSTIDISNLPTDVPVALGYSLSNFLYGILVVQVFIYFSRFTKDSKWIRLYVLLLFVLETTSASVVLYETLQGAKYHCLSCIPLSSETSWDLGWSFRAICALTGFISLLAHGFYSWRIRVMSHSWYIPIFVMLTSLLQCTFISIGTISSNIFSTPAVVSNVWAIASLVCDFVITTETIRLLFRYKKKLSSNETSNMTTKLIRLTCETGAVTTGFMVLQFVLSKCDMTSDAVTFLSTHEITISQWPFSFSIDQLSVFYLMSRLYANCLVASLNARLVLSSDNSHLEAVSTILFDHSELSILPITERPTKSHVSLTIMHSRLTIGDNLDTGEDTDDGSTDRSEKHKSRHLSLDMRRLSPCRCTREVSDT